jgi:hypothetical protein
MKYTTSNRNDGAWDLDDDEIADSIGTGDPIEVFKRRKNERGDYNGSLRPICVIENPDLEEGGDCPGNIALIVYAPEMYETLKTVSVLKLPHTCKNVPEGFEESAALSCAACRVKDVVAHVEEISGDIARIAKDAIEAQ